MMLHDHFMGFRFRAESNAPTDARGPSACARTVILTVPAAPETVFNFLADVENLPRWAAGFCERLEISAGRWTALTSFGDLWIELAADVRAGSIDLLAAEDAGLLEPLFSVRIGHAPDGGTRIRFLLEPRAGYGAECHERHYREFLLDLRGLLVRFGGGDLKAEIEASRPPAGRRHEARPEIAPAGAGAVELQRAFDRSWTGLGGSLFERLRPGAWEPHGEGPGRELPMDGSGSIQPALAVLRPVTRRALGVGGGATSGRAPQEPKEGAAGREACERGAARPVELRPWYDDIPATPGFGFRGLL